MKISFIVTCFLILSVTVHAQVSKSKRPVSIPTVDLNYDLTPYLPSDAKTIASYIKLLTSDDTWSIEEASMLYYKSQDSIWYEVAIPWETVKLDTANLDGMGRPEIVLSCETCHDGSGGRSCDGASIILNIEAQPVELLNIKNYCFQEIYGRTYGDDSVAVTGCYGEYRREVTVQNDLIIIHPNNLEALNEFHENCAEQCELTPLPSGTYKFSAGHLRLIKR